MKCNEELSSSVFFEKKKRWSTVWSIISVVQDVLRISGRIHATTFVVLPNQSETEG